MSWKSVMKIFLQVRSQKDNKYTELLIMNTWIIFFDNTH